jgi:hypothetical protein
MLESRLPCSLFYPNSVVVKKQEETKNTMIKRRMTQASVTSCGMFNTKSILLYYKHGGMIKRVERADVPALHSVGPYDNKECMTRKRSIRWNP